MPVFVLNVNQKKNKKKPAEKSKLKKNITPLVIIAAVVIIDQLTKHWAVTSLVYGEPCEVIGNFFKLSLIYNEGGAMGTNFGSPTYYLISSILILLFVLYYIYVNRENKPITIPLSFIAGGAIGNIIDRLIYGEVVDFLDFDFFDINLFGYQLERWWTFNMADAFISCSIIYLLYKILFAKHSKPQKQESP